MWLVRFLIGTVFLIGAALTGYATLAAAELHPGQNIVWLLAWVAAGCLANGVLFIALSTKRETAR